MKEVVKKKVLKWLNSRFIYEISDSSWVSPMQVVPKKGALIRVKNDKLISTRIVTCWRILIDYRKLNKATRKHHFPYLLLIICLIGWKGMLIIVSFIDTSATIRL